MGRVANHVKEQGGASVIVALGTALLASHAIHATDGEETVQSITFGIFIPAVLSIWLIGAGVWLWYSETDGPVVGRIAAWSLAGAGVLAVGSLLTIFYQQAEGVVMTDQVYVVVNGMTGGAVGGVVVGIYDWRQRASRQRARQLSECLTVINRVLRHDIRNRANVMDLYAELIEEDHSDAAQKAGKIRGQTTEITRIGEKARKIEQLIQSQQAERNTISVESATRRAIESVRSQYPEADIEVSLIDAGTVRANPLIDAAIKNVVENAVEHHTDETPTVTVTTDRLSRGGTDYVEVEIADDGPGIPDSEVAVLERGFETSLEHVSGLGLWLVHWVVTASDGNVEFVENEPSGSIVRLQFESTDRDDPPATAATA